MRAEAASWDDWSASNAAPIAEDDKWHVALAPDEVKIVSLEQLDDLFRLSIVDAETKVWQTGMSEWQPLRIIAGLDEQAPPAPKRTHPKPPSPRSAPPAPRSAPPAPRSAPPAPRSAPLHPANATPASFYPEPVALAPAPVTFAAPVAPAVPRQLGSVRPLVVSHAPEPVRSGGFGRVLLGLAVLAGLSITLYRNGVVRDGAHAAHQDALFARLETALGGPAFGTLRAVEQTAQGAAAAALGVPSSTAASAVVPTAATAVAVPVPTAGSAPPVVSLESLAPEKKASASSPKLDAPAAAATPSTSKFKAKSNEYDPLNPKL